MHTFQRSRTWLCIIFNDVVEHLIHCFRDLLFWDDARLTRERIAEYAAAIERKGGVRGVWGFIDGTMRAICRPQENQELFYSGYKKCHAVKYQAVSTPDGLIGHLAGPYTGRESDWTAYQNSGLASKLRGLKLVDDTDPAADRFYIYGDPAYSLSYGIICAYQAQPNRQLSPLLQEVNAHMSSLRISVEHGFGRLMMLWGYNGFKMGLKIGLSPVAAYFMVSVLFCNIHSCFHENQTSKKFHCPPPSVHSYLASAGTRT